MNVIVINKQPHVKVPTGMTVQLKKVLQEASKLYELPSKCELSLAYVDNAMIKELNNKYRGIDEPTDVLSFAMSEGEEFPTGVNQPTVLGDIVISTERAYEQAAEYGHSIQREMAYLAIHGFLHLIGFDHMNDADKATMRENEEYILTKLGLTRDSD